MKSKLLPIKQYFALIFAVLIALNTTFAAPVSHDLAKQIASNFFIHKRVIEPDNEKNSKAPKIQSVELQEQPFFVFNYDSQQGYVIVAADDCAHPILGYATEGYFDINNIPPNMQKWLEMYKNEIQYATSNQLESPPEVISKWQTLMAPDKPKNENTFQASPILLTTQWNQAPNYNWLCPYSPYYSERTVVGCTATAMAQIMKYWNYPTTGTGFHSYNHSKYGTLSAAFGSTTYNWTNMPSRLTNASSSAQITAVATLMYHCGVSVDMDYNVSQEGGSGAYVIAAASNTCAENALKTYFGYKETLQGIIKSRYTNTNWINLLRTEIDAGRPILYAGYGSGGGHAFVCDGYEDNNYFHFNWGWSGQNDGYFSLSALNPGSGGAGGGDYEFSSDQQAVIGIEPGDNSGGGGGEPTPSTDIQLYSDIEMADDYIWFGDDIEVTVDIGNFATADFTGQICAAIFDEDYNFIEYLEIQDVALPARKYRTHTFSNIDETVFVPGTYYIAMFYKTATQNWTMISSSDYTTRKWFEIYYSTDIEVYSDFTIKTNNGNLIQNSKATINVDVLNSETSTFYGEFRLSLANLSGGGWEQNIAIIEAGDDGLKPNYHYVNGLNFTGDITVEPGTYLLEVGYRSAGTSQWYYAGSSDYSNPIYVIVEAPVITADKYEANNTEASSHFFISSFTANEADLNTTGSNFHIGTDIDYYHIALPTTYDYTITARLHDEYNSGNSEDYTVDALFWYTSENVYGDNYYESETYDDVMPNDILLPNGGLVYFGVAPYYSGSTGTYLLEINISRKPITGIDDATFQNDINVFPNPASNFITINLHNIKQNLNVSKIELCDINGKQISSENISNSMEIITLSLENIAANGTYFVKIYSDEGIVTKKIVLQKE